MTTYCNTIKKCAGKLNSSARTARWNSNGRFLINSAGSLAWPCREDIVHRRDIGQDELFRVTIIDIPNDLKIKKMTRRQLKANWQDFLNYDACRAIVDKWLKENKTAIL